MYQTYDDLPEGQIKKRNAQYRYNNVWELIHEFYHVDASEWLEQCNEEQFKKAFAFVGKQLSYEEVKEVIEKG